MKEHIQLKSKCTAFSSEIDLASEITKYSYVLLIKSDGVSVVRGSDSPSLDKLVELRAFDKDKELHVVKTGTGLIGRIREDGIGDITSCYDEQQLLWGTVISSNGNESALYDDRGISLNVPVSAEKGERILLSVRSYLDSKCFEFVDYRLVDLSSAKVGEYNV